MRHSVFGDCEYLQDVAPERALHIVQVYLGDVGAHDLLRGVVHERVKGAILLHVLVNGFAACLVVHEISGNEETLAALLLNHFFRVLSIFFLLWQVHDGYVGAFTSKQNSSGPSDARARQLTSEKWHKMAHHAKKPTLRQ